MPLVFSKRDPQDAVFRQPAALQHARRRRALEADQPRSDATRGRHAAESRSGDREDDYHVGKRRGVIYTIAPSPLDAQVIWVGTDDGLVWRTADGGAHWTQRDARGADARGRRSAASSCRISSRASPTWRSIVIVWMTTRPISMSRVMTARAGSASIPDIPRGSFVNVVREDPVRPGPSLCRHGVRYLRVLR